VLADVFGCGGIRGTLDWYRAADLFHLGLGMHSGTELGIGHAAKMQAIGAMGDRVLHAMDAIYPEYVGDVIEGDPFAISDGSSDFPNAPGLGVTLDEESLGTYELTAERHRDLNDWWEECKRRANVTAASSSMLTRSF
jgi:glucarate dehydratase